MARTDAARPFSPRSLWRNLFTRHPRPTRPGRPRLECLEDRLVPSTFTVNSLADANAPAGVMTLRQALLAANADSGTDSSNPDVINFSVSGTIVLNSQLPAVMGNVMIEGPGASVLTVQGDHQSDAIFTLGQDSTVSLSGLTLFGNGRFNSGISVGAAASLNLQNSVIQDVACPGNGGAIDSEAGGTVTVSGVSFLTDLAGLSGGAIANVGGTLTVVNSTFSNGLAFEDQGGAIYDSPDHAGNGGSLTVIGCTFSDNVAAGFGGAIDLGTGAKALVGNSTFAGNSAGDGGGGAISLYFDGIAPPPLTISLDLLGSTVVGNSTSGAAGGGIYVDATHTFVTTEVVLRDSIVAGNLLTTVQGGQTLPASPSDVSAPLDPSSAYNIIGDGSGATGVANTLNGNLIGTNAAPLNPLLGPLQNNGGSTLTMAPLPGSPAIDRGAPDPLLDALTNSDQAGNPRVVAQSFVVSPSGGDGRDIGAYELPAQSPTILVVNSLADANAPAGVLTLREALQAAAATIPLSALPASQVTAGSAYVYEIQFSVSGTIALGSQLPAVANAGVIIQGPGAPALTLQGDGLNDRILTVAPDASAVVSGVTLLAPNFQNSGILVGADATLAVENSVLDKLVSQQGDGGAIDNEAGGGAISVSGDSFLHDFAAGFGGAIDSDGGSLSVSTSTFDHDTSIFSGAGIYDSSDFIAGGGSLTITASTFSNDQSSQFGGGVAMGTGTNAVISDCTFTADNADDSGGGISLNLDGQSPSRTIALQLLNCTIDGNTDFDFGAGLYVDAQSPVLQVTAYLEDCIVGADNSISFSNGQTIYSPDDVSGPIASDSIFNLIGDGSQLTGITNGFDDNRIGTDAAPIDPMVGPLQNNGGPTLTMAPLPGSPALDNGSGLLLEATDQRGVARGRTIDLGAYQATASVLQVSTSSPATADVPQAGSVEAFDSFGQPAYDMADNLVFSSSDPLLQFSGPTVMTNAVDNFFIAFGTPGTQSLTVSDAREGLVGTLPNIQVDQSAVNVGLTSSANPSVFGQSVTLTASVSGTNSTAGTPTGGLVTFFNGTKTLGTATLQNGSASISVASLTAGTYSLTAGYAGNTSFSGGTSPDLSQTVDRAASASRLSVSPSPATFGQSVTLTATLSAVSPGSGTPQGTVTFRDGSVTLGTARVNPAGVATFQTSALAVGSHSLTAVWGGDSNYIGSTSPAVTETIDPLSAIPTTTALASNVNPSVYGEAVTFTATVSGSGGTPTGTVTFEEAGKTLGRATLSNGVASFTTTSLPAGSASISAVYGGDAAFTGSTSPTLTQTEQKATTTTTLSVTPTNPSVGQELTLTAQLAVVAPGGGIPQGTVTFHDGSTVLGTARLNAAGVATFQTTALTAGSHALTASWGGDSNNLRSTSETVTVVVAAAPAVCTDDVLAPAEAVISAETSLLIDPVDLENGTLRGRA